MRLSDLWTENDGKSLCPMRVHASVLVTTFVGGVGYSLWHGKDFAMQDFGIAAAALIGAIGAVLGYNKGKEPYQ